MIVKLLTGAALIGALFTTAPAMAGDAEAGEPMRKQTVSPIGAEGLTASTPKLAPVRSKRGRMPFVQLRASGDGDASDPSRLRGQRFSGDPDAGPPL